MITKYNSQSHDCHMILPRGPVLLRWSLEQILGVIDELKLEEVFPSLLKVLVHLRGVVNVHRAVLHIHKSKLRPFLM